MASRAIELFLTVMYASDGRAVLQKKFTFNRYRRIRSDSYPRFVAEPIVWVPGQTAPTRLTMLPYRPPHGVWEMIIDIHGERNLDTDKMLDVLLANGCIEHSTCADWNSPVILVSKGDGRWRLVIDFRGPNLAVENEAVVYPRPEDIFEMCQDALYMFLIDGRDFYFQRLLDENCRDITTFRCHRGIFRWCRAPQERRR